MELVALAFGLVIVFGIMMAVLLAAFALTGWPWLGVANIVVVALVVISVVYLAIQRSKLIMKL